MMHQYKNPTDLLLEPFLEGSDTIFQQLEGYLYLYGMMGEEVTKNLGVLPPSIERLVEACKGKNAFNVLDAYYKVQKEDIEKVSPEDAKNIVLMFTQTVARGHDGMKVCEFLCATDWDNPTEDDKENLVRLMNPLEYSEGSSVKQLYYRNRRRVGMLKRIPPNQEVIDYAEPQQYGAFIRSLRLGNMKDFVKAYKLITPISFVYPSGFE